MVFYPVPRLYLRASLALSSVIINLPKIRSVIADTECPNGDDKLVLLRVQDEGASMCPLVKRPYEYYFCEASALSTDAWPSALADLNADARSYLKSQNASLITHNIELDYDYWTAGSLDAPFA